MRSFLNILDMAMIKPKNVIIYLGLPPLKILFRNCGFLVPKATSKMKSFDSNFITLC